MMPCAVASRHARPLACMPVQPHLQPTDGPRDTHLTAACRGRWAATGSLPAGGLASSPRCPDPQQGKVRARLQSALTPQPSGQHERAEQRACGAVIMTQVSGLPGADSMLQHISLARFQPCFEACVSNAGALGRCQQLTRQAGWNTTRCHPHVKACLQVQAPTP